jgi:class 3 adenylate cyclase/tetratricopeptide (TPR) repeat protein
MARKERKVVTVVFADLVGFTSRAESLDPEDVQAILDPYHARLRSELERHGGTVEKFIGDAVMAVFGAPVVHEDDAERAVRAALAIRDWAREEGDVEVRIAVNTGEALVMVDADPDSGQGMVAGDVVNTAARLQATAPVNGILVGEATRRSTERAIEYAAAAAVEAKGKPEPVPVWEAVAARARLGVDLGETARRPLVGREREVDLLRATLARVRDEETPYLVTLVGVPGIGKSRLVRELFDELDRAPEVLFWRQGRSLPYGEGVTYWALAEMVKAQAGILESDDAAEVQAKLARAAGDLVADDAAWIEPHLRALLGQGGDEQRGDTRADAFAAWRRFFESVAENAPLVLVFEDTHWADDGLLDFIDHLVDWATGVPILLVCTARPELLTRRPGWGGGKLNATTVSLSPLSSEETARLVHALLDQAVLPAELQTVLLERAGGNPLYAEEFARVSVQRAAEGGDLPLPESIQSLIAARIDGLAADEKAALEDAAVIGKLFWSGSVAALGDNEREAVEAALHALERKEFVQRERRSSIAGENQYAFRHLLVRDVAYGQIPRARRADKHKLAAEWIAALGRQEEHAELLAHHYLSALDFARAAGQDVGVIAAGARVALREAGDLALSLSAARAATGFYRAALELWPDRDPERPELLFSLGRAEEPIDDVSARETLAAARDGLLAAGLGARAAEADVLLAEITWRHGEAAAAKAHLDHAAGLIDGAPPSHSKAWVTSQLSRFHMLASRYDESARFAQEALEMADRLGLDDVRADALNNLSASHFVTDGERSKAQLEESIAISERLGSPQAFRAYNNLAHQLIERGFLEEADSVDSRGLERAERLGYPEWMNWLREKRAQIWFHGGRWDDSLALVESQLLRIETGTPHYLETSWRAVRAQILLARGHRRAALADTDRSVETGRRVREPQMFQPALALHLSVVLADRQAATAVLDELLESLSVRIGLRSHYWTCLADGARELGRSGEVAALLQPRAEVDPWVRAAAAVARADFAQAAAIFRTIGSLPMEAEYRRRVAVELFAEGRREEAAAELEHALAFWRSVGATAYLQEAQASLEVAS